MASFNHYNHHGQLIRSSIFDFTRETTLLKQVLDKIRLYSINFISKEDLEVYKYGTQVHDCLDGHHDVIHLMKDSDAAITKAKEHDQQFLIKCISRSSLLILLEALEKIPLHLPKPNTGTRAIPTSINLKPLQKKHHETLDHIDKLNGAYLLDVSRPTFDKHVSSRFKSHSESYLWMIEHHDLSLNLERQVFVNDLIHFFDILTGKHDHQISRFTRSRNPSKRWTHRSAGMAIRLISESLKIHLPRKILQSIIEDHLLMRDS
jgi:hypothetical protein